MRYSNYLLINRIFIVISFACFIIGAVGSGAVFFNIISIHGKYNFLLPCIIGLGCILCIIALVSELIRYKSHIR